jgi:hypothetical protein
MQSKGIDITPFGASLKKPSVDEFGIYRLMAEVKHALSGHYCRCFIRACQHHSKHETHLSKESEGDYGFHGVNPWERWQLLNFYSDIFAHPNFDAQKMQDARRNDDAEALERYLDTLVPNCRNKIRNVYLADGLFPKFRAKLIFRDGLRPPCLCVVHSTLTSEGLDELTLFRISDLRDMAQGDGVVENPSC